jgi:hypothetical protein
MISTKVFLALALSGLGAASMGADAYLMFGKRPKIPAAQAETPRPKPTPPVAASHPPEEVNHVVTIDTVMVYGHMHHHVATAPAAAKKSGLVPCSDWRSLESGPAGRGVRTLCTE